MVIYLDLQQPFDKVPHERLHNKHKYADIRDNLMAWIRGWLTERKQHILLNSQDLECLLVISGVPLETGPKYTT